MNLIEWLRSGLRKLRRCVSLRGLRLWLRSAVQKRRSRTAEPEAVTPVSEQPPATQARSVSLPPRHVHLGVDFGTCWSKLVLRDYQAPTDRCFVVRPGHAFDAGNNYRIPSSVTVLDDRLHFGWTGERLASRPGAHVIRSPKMGAAFPSSDEDNGRHADLSAEDVSILVVTYLLQVGFSCARDYCAKLSPATAPRMSMSMGVPMSVLDESSMRERFLTIARVAFYIWKVEDEQPTLAGGIDIDHARELIAVGRKQASGRPAISSRDWIRSEAEAGLLWIYRSPLVGEGLHGCVDIGAGTTDVSFFRIRMRHEDDAWVKDALGFYSARSAPPAMDTLDDGLAKINGHGLSRGRLRGKENNVIREHVLAKHPSVQSVCREIYETYRRAWADAYAKEKRESAWSHYGLFVLGGGSKVDPVVESLRGSVWPGRLAGCVIGDAGFPHDLYDWPRMEPLVHFREDATFLLVAYGLSHLGGDVPVVDNPSEIEPLEIPQGPRTPIDQDEYYPK